MRVVSQSIESRIGIMQLDKRNAQNSRLASTVISAGTHEKPSVQRSTVSISGEALLRQRLFHVTDPNRTLPVLGKAECGRSYPDISFLTLDDRALLEMRMPGHQARALTLHTSMNWVSSWLITERRTTVVSVVGTIKA